MSENSNIEWTDHTWSPWDGCTKVSPGCKNCYAEARDKRHLIEDVDHWGKGAPRRLRKDWNSPIKWNKEAVCVKCGKAWPDRGMHPDCDGKSQDFRRQRVFPSLCDWLDEEVPNLWLGRFLSLVNATPNLTWQLLTKRPELFESRMKAVAGEEMPWAILARRWLDGNSPSNVWVGTSVEDQEWADKRVPALLRIPAQIRFLSVEPLLDPVDLLFIDKSDGMIVEKMEPVDWVIVGGESGIGARPCNVDWVRSIVIQCAYAGVPCFVKQLGARVIDRNDRGFEGDNGPSGWPMDTEISDTIEPGVYQGKPILVRLKHPKGGDPSEWPEEFKVREVPSDL
jgi:protein gp37